MEDRFKFRVWDFGKNKFGYLEFNSDGFSISIIYNDYIPVDDGYCKPISELISELQQCTGLKDKSGKLIYEGDVIKHFNNIGVVEFGDCSINNNEYYSYGYYLKYKHYDSIYVIHEVIKELLIQDNNSQIMGNIYENPKLLESD